MKSRLSIRSLLIVAVAFIALGSLWGQSTTSYHLIHTYAFGTAPDGHEYFDYIFVDPGSRRAYVSHGTEVLVVNADTGVLEGKISGLKRSHGIAVVPDLGRGFITDGEQGKIIVFDLKSLKTLDAVGAADDADCVIYDQASRRIFSFNGDSHNSTVLDPATGKVVGTIELGGSPEYAVADGRGMIYNNLEDKGEVLAIDARKLKIESRWPIAPAGGPTAIAMDREHRRLFIASREPAMLTVMNADSGKILKEFSISDGADAAVYDAESGRVFVSTRAGWIHVFHEDSPERYSEMGRVRTEFGAKTMGFDSKLNHLLVDTATFAKPAPDAKHARPAAIPGTFRLLIYAQ